MINHRDTETQSILPRGRCVFLKKLCAFVPLWFISLFLFSWAASAQEEEKAPVTYSPDYCEFSVTFPEEPQSMQRCEEGDEDRCYDLITYTHVYDMAATVEVRVICNPISEDLYSQYSGAVMEATVKAMTEKNVIKTFDTSFREEEHYKQAGLVGEGQLGMSPTIYIAQLWIGRHSIMSVEAEMTGDVREDADTLFSDILRSVQYSGIKDTKEEPEEPDSEN